ncbi:DNA-binding transcriptional regulator, LysR family [Amycolatopsis sacchari]|uniref:DNA-binding transcriptional regulator, LysR family n=1 Tax=Amycolatopsis sacchari TaxID=115433 RepID=A0A1I3K6Z0_9PSEU|nr:LysR substrate-binding domain-containing protein [Amycolatopsis sacchari]SFI68293.1 DNA-binding transcriptional regulator, LysR family [Amycolatopsis sacchari]
MELRHLRYFVTVAETCHFGRAAERLHIAQPALSQAIRQLEAELGASLFTRTTRQVALTAAGGFFLAEARRVLGTVEESVRGVRRIADGRLGLVRIGFTGTAAFSHLPAIARRVQQELPGVALEIEADLLTPAQCDALRDGTLDLAVLRPPTRGDGIELRTLEVEPLILAVPAAHPLATAPTVSVADLRGEGFVGYASKDSVVNDAVNCACQAAGFSPRREHDAAGTAVLLALVAGGLGVAVVPASARALPLAGVVFRDLADGGTVELALAWRGDDDSPLVRAVLDVLETPGCEVSR